MSLAPIVLFVFNRPEHTLKTLEALSQNYLADQSDLIIFCDGPKEVISEEELRAIQEVRKIVKKKKWCRTVEIREFEFNNGLANSIIAGVTEIVNKYNKVIVLEDDLITSPFFLRFMNDGLIKFDNNKNVYSVNGHMFPIEVNSAESVLLPYISTWGWATWRDSWETLDVNMTGYQNLISSSFLKQRFNLADYDYTHMLSFKNNSWGIKWYFSVFSQNGLGLFPTKSLVSNIGFDGTGTNCGDENLINSIYKNEISVKVLNSIDFKFYSKYLLYFKKENIEYRKRFKIKNFIKRYVSKIFQKIDS